MEIKTRNIAKSTTKKQATFGNFVKSFTAEISLEN